MRKKVLSVLLCTAMTATMLAGCGNSADSGKQDTATDQGTVTSDEASSAAETSAPPENVVSGDADAEDAFVIWGWNDDIKKILDGPFKKDNPDAYSRIVFVNTGGSDYYQTKVDEILSDESNSLYPDLMGLEVDYVLKYVNSEYLLSANDLGISDGDVANMYQYTKDLSTDADGNQKAFFWQATPGSWQIRADLAKKYLGTTDADELQKKYFSSWDKIVKAAEKVNKAGKGKVKLLSGYTDIFRVFSNSRTTGWYDDNDVITVDENMNEYMKVAKQLFDGDLTYNTEQWTTDWESNKEGDGKNTNAAVAFTGCPWYTYWSLKDSWKENTILVPGPQQFYWGGTGLAATAGCADPELAASIIKYFACDKDSMVKINKLNSDFVNNTEAVKEIMKGKSTCEYVYGDQNFMEFYLPLADGIDASTSTAEDQTINSLWDTQVKEYVNGNVSEEDAIAAFKAAVHDTYDYLSAE